MNDLVTGEAVAVDLRLAKLPTRALARVIDLGVQGAALVGVTLAVGAASPALDEALLSALFLVGTVGIMVGYPVAMETATRGRTLGKMALGLRVVRDDGGAIRFRQAFVRALTAVVEIYMFTGVPAVLTSIVSGRGKRVGDIFAGTVVVRERVPRRGAAYAGPGWRGAPAGAPAGAGAWLPPVPPALAPWAARLEMSALPDDLAFAARQYVARASELNPAAREAVGARIAADVARYVSPPAPSGTSVWGYLTAVLGERHRREMARLGGPHTRPAPPPSAGPPPHAGPPPYAGAVTPPIDPAPPRGGPSGGATSGAGGFAPPG